ncbi:tyrosine-type recombinase/integrase [Shimia sp.]|uniref:tyrosine-type recombinase/integrase n=1 Tax=Shimia sp. TaxID=1954381 RepID=UPI003297317E
MKIDITKPHALRAALKGTPEGQPVEITDKLTAGLSARIRMINGVPVGQWNCRVTIGGKTKRISLGSVAEITGEQARLAALQAKATAKGGQAIVSASTAARTTAAAQEKQEKQDAVHSLTWADVLFAPHDGPSGERQESYQARVWDKKRSGRDAINSIKRLFGDDLNKPMVDLTRHRMEALYLSRADTAPHAAANAVRYFRPAFVHYATRDYPTNRDALDLVESLMKPPSRGGQYEKPTRDRVLTPSDWTALWNAAPETPAGWAMKLAMMTGVRNREACALRVSEVDLENRIIELPATRSKNKSHFRVVLGDKAIVIITTAMQTNADRGMDTDLVFTNDGTAPVWLGDNVKKAIDQNIDVADWRFHDFRRAMASHLAESGVDDSLVDLMLNHAASKSRSGVLGVYNLSEKMEQRRVAIAKWEQITDRWITGKSAKIVKIG